MSKAIPSVVFRDAEEVSLLFITHNLIPEVTTAIR